MRARNDTAAAVQRRDVGASRVRVDAATNAEDGVGARQSLDTAKCNGVSLCAQDKPSHTRTHQASQLYRVARVDVSAALN
jgi:hypothetical protein